ncbi:unnamed protein product [Brachionus calyciflorus]|uniref:Sperm-associated antigen 8 n=1 Tax=Brachionus calyciflorus TaxID=104777 RepID=A0A813SQX6_9BILA|nr:unnamed protein product [Brachionus calyciflorus]
MSSFYPNTLDQRRLYNSDSKTLLQNWVEERSVKKFDQVPDEYIQTDQALIKHFKHGHRGILTVNEQAPNSKYTVYKDDYIKRDNYDPNGEPKGIRYKLTEQAIRNKLIDEMNQQVENDYQDEPNEYKSEFQEKYDVPGFRHEPPKPTAKHDLYSEMPVSYWTEQRNRVHGVTQFKTLDSPFRRNAAFSTPVEISLDQAKPGEIEKFPFMSQKDSHYGVIP